MLGVLCTRPKPWIISPLSFTHGASYYRLAGGPISRSHLGTCLIERAGGAAASIWHAILPSGGFSGDSCRKIRPALRVQKGEGSWNVAWDVRPARWLHGSDSAWLLFGLRACFTPLDWGANLEVGVEEVVGIVGDTDDEHGILPRYRITGVPGDGRCLFRAIVHGNCLRSGKEAPEETHQGELADELRAQVADELLKRRNEIEWSMEEDFDTYVERIQQPYVWGGEPELLMASHVLKTPISVYMMDSRTGSLINIASYGQEYGEDTGIPIKVLFHGYGHYDSLEIFTD